MDIPKLSSFISTWLATHNETLTIWRRHLHQHPELSHQEKETTTFIATQLRSLGLNPTVLPLGGVVVDITSGRADAPLIAFRGDIDALPIAEASGVEFSSLNDGVMHACGHDMHTTIVLGLAAGLHAYVTAYGADALPVSVRCIFQPAEEVMDGGATDVITAGALRGVQQIFAVHCEPKLRVGEIGLRTGPITSASDVLEIVLTGPGGHTSRPHLSADLVYAAGALVTQLPGLLSRRVDPRAAAVLVFGAINGGSTFNAMPREVRLLGTFRTADVRLWREGEALLTSLVQQVVAPTGAHAEVLYTKGVPPVTNDDVATALLAQAVNDIDPAAGREAPQSTGGEDFSWYLEQVPGSMARLGTWSGSGKKFDLHQQDIIFDERALAIGVRLFAGVITQFQKEQF